MTASQRSALLKYAAIGVVGLFLLDRVVITPATQSWGDQGERIAALRKKVERGEALLEREANTRGRWNEMKRANLSPDNAVAENQAYQAMVLWAQKSGVITNSLTPQWQNHEDGGYETFEMRATLTGNQAALGKYIYALEVDPLPVNLEECELVTRDPHGAQLTMTMRFTFARLVTTVTAASTGTNNNNISGGRIRQ